MIMKKELILHIPHSSIEIPLNDGYISSSEILQDEILKLTDWYTDDIFFSEKDIIVKAEFSRIFCDVERFSNDEEEEMAKFGMGVLYIKSDDGLNIRSIDEKIRNNILTNYYWKHHNKLDDSVKNQLDKNGIAQIIDCHSFPNIPFKCSVNIDEFRPDINIGTDSFHTPMELLDITKSFFEEKGFTVGVDKPYSGTIVPLEYYRKEKNVKSIMIEINRKLYLKGSTNEKNKNYTVLKKIIQEYLDLVRL